MHCGAKLFHADGLLFARFRVGWLHRATDWIPSQREAGLVDTLHHRYLPGDAFRLPELGTKTSLHTDAILRPVAWCAGRMVTECIDVDKFDYIHPNVCSFAPYRSIRFLSTESQPQRQVSCGFEALVEHHRRRPRAGADGLLNC